MDRQKVLATLENNPEVSVLIVGGGINGIGLFRELASQGVDVLLVEKSDFCSGASAASSHMMHGGLRYLENAEFRLVREALRERNRLLLNAPHYVHPLPTTIPIFRWVSGILNAPLKFLNLTEEPAERGALVIKIGLTFYDWFTRGHQTMPFHKFHGKEASLKKRPWLNSNIIATAQYYDAWMPYPERICMELIMDAEAMSSQAHALNYVSLSGGGGDVATITDELTGKTYDVKPKIVVNAAGPWIDFANEAVNEKTRFIGGTKGSHLIIDHDELHTATRGEEIFFENEDGRIVLFFPLLDKVLVGTTDIRIENPNEARCTQEEADYLLGMISHVFPSIKVDPSQVVFKFSGVRPLANQETATTGRITRDHTTEIVEANAHHNYPIYSLIGGKWTTFRAFGEHTADMILPRLGVRRTKHTDNMPIGGGKDYPLEDALQRRWIMKVADKTGVSPERVRTLFDRYGTRAQAIADFISGGSDTILQHKPDYSRCEVIYIAKEEKVVHLDDFLLRRSLIAMLGYLTHDLAEELSRILAEALNWTEAQRQEEIERTLAIMLDHHDVKL